MIAYTVSIIAVCRGRKASSEQSCGFVPVFFVLTVNLIARHEIHLTLAEDVDVLIETALRGETIVVVKTATARVALEKDAQRKGHRL